MAKVLQIRRYARSNYLIFCIEIDYFRESNIFIICYEIEHLGKETCAISIPLPASAPANHGLRLVGWQCCGLSEPQLREYLASYLSTR